MRQRELDAIYRKAMDQYDGDVRLAAAAHIHGDAVIARSGNAIPAGADYPAIDALAESIVKRVVPKKKPASPKKASGSKAKAKPAAKAKPKTRSKAK